MVDYNISNMYVKMNILADILGKVPTTTTTKIKKINQQKKIKNDLSEFVHFTQNKLRSFQDIHD